MTEKVICYLCGKDIIGEKSDDHVPPKQFYAKIYRKILNLNLLTLPTHEKCNTSYQKDEDYFVHSIAPIAMNTKTGSDIWVDIKKAVLRNESRGLINKVLNEFTDRPYGLYLPSYLIAKMVDSNRIKRVIWKITRGLYFYEFNKMLPEETELYIDLYDQYHKPIEAFKYVRDTESKGRYPGVFDYKFTDTNEYVIWGMLFWDYFISLIIHKKPN